MKLKVLRQFYDTSAHYPGEVIEVTDERGKELLGDDRGLVEELKKPARKKGSESLTAES